MNEGEILAELYLLYDDGRKMPGRRCWKCKFVVGYYLEAGLVRYDPGCYCTGSPVTKLSSEENLLRFIRRLPGKAEGWIKYREAEIIERAEVERLRKKLQEERGARIYESQGGDRGVRGRKRRRDSRSVSAGDMLPLWS